MNHDSILIVDDETEVLDYLESSLLCHGYPVHSARDGGEALDILSDQNESIALVVLDLMMPRKDGIETLNEIRKTSKELPVVALSGTSDPNRIVKAMNAGANDFLQKPVAHQKLIETVKKNVGNGRRANGSANGKQNGNGELYHSHRMKSVVASLDQLAPWDVPVIFRGESGVGKEVLVRDLHRRSPRASKPFVKINCVALPAELLESELFGYDKGAFTGAFQAKAGKFEIANRGTIFLDEIGDMDLNLQAKLLQVLQDGEFYRLGGKEPVKVDVRVVAATHRNLEAAVRQGEFREDLYHRLDVVTIRIPPLRERPEEIVPLAEHFLVKHSREDSTIPEIPLRLREALVAYRWSGNVRELENLMRRFLVFQDPDLLDMELRRRESNSFHVETSRSDVHSPAVAVSQNGRNGGADGSVHDVSWHRDPTAETVQDARGYSSTELNGDAEPTRQSSHASTTDNHDSLETSVYGKSEAIVPPTRHVVLEDGSTLQEDVESVASVGAENVPFPDGGRLGTSVGAGAATELLTITEVDEAQRNIEKRAIMAALSRTNWNRKKAAQLLKIDYKALLYKMKKLDM